jgi:hypothetical protein
MTVKIGMDYHGVITANPSFFAQFNKKALEKGCFIYILSGGSKKDIEPFLLSHRISYSTLWSLPDYFKTQHNITFFQNGTFKVDDLLWNKAKAQYCRENEIDFFIDDSMLYGHYFTTLFCLYDHKAARCFLDHGLRKTLDFTLPPVAVLEDILTLIGQTKAK